MHQKTVFSLSTQFPIKTVTFSPIIEYFTTSANRSVITHRLHEKRIADSESTRNFIDKTIPKRLIKPIYGKVIHSTSKIDNFEKFEKLDTSANCPDITTTTHDKRISTCDSPTKFIDKMSNKTSRKHRLSRFRACFFTSRKSRELCAYTKPKYIQLSLKQSKERPIKIENTFFHDFTSCKLSTEVTQFLSYGDKFIPPSNLTTNDDIRNGINRLTQLIGIKSYFKNQKATEFDHRLRLPPSRWNPPVIRGVFDLQHGIKRTSNLILSRDSEEPVSKRKQSFTDKLIRSIPKDIIIVKADKNLGLVAMDLISYNAQVLRHLYNPTDYTKLTVPQKDDYVSLLKKERLLLLDKLEVKYGKTSHTMKYLAAHLGEETIPKFHILPKIHKFLPNLSISANLENIQTRPIAGATSWITTSLSKILAIRLEKVSTPFVIKNSAELISDLQRVAIIPEMIDQYTLITADAESLYTNIDIKKLLDIVNLHCDHLSMVITKFIVTNSLVQYNKEFFKQTRGIAMGTNAAVMLANIYLTHVTDIPFRSFCRDKDNPIQKEFDTLDQYYDHLEDQEPLDQGVKYYCRYIDDVFILYLGSLFEFQDVYAPMLQKPKINLRWISNGPNDNNSLTFLDVDIKINKEELKFDTKCHFKPTNKGLYIPFTSCHPRSTLKGYIYGEYLRYLSLSSNATNYLEGIDRFHNALLKRGYPINFIQQVQVPEYRLRQSRLPLPSNTRLSFMEPIQMSVISTKRQKKNTDTRHVIPFVHTFSSRRILRDLRREITKYNEDKHIIELNSKIVIAYRMRPNIGKLFLKSDLTKTQSEYLAHSQLSKSTLPT
jgi:hypothetical protein